MLPFPGCALPFLNQTDISVTIVSCNVNLFSGIATRCYLVELIKFVLKSPVFCGKKEKNAVFP